MTTETECAPPSKTIQIAPTVTETSSSSSNSSSNSSSSSTTTHTPPPSPTWSSSHSSSDKRITARCSVTNLGKSQHSTGICFLDHMIDQLTSHGQLGVTMEVSIDGVAHRPHVDYRNGVLEGREHDGDIFRLCGAALGEALRGLVDYVVSRREKAGGDDGGGDAVTVEEVFCCPLDEAFSEATLRLSSQSSSASSFRSDLAPYGTMPPQGRRWIGCYRCELTPLFFQHLTASLGGASLTLRKVRGHNAHHIVESAFKSFARVFRASLDAIEVGGRHGCVLADEHRLPPVAGGGAAGQKHRTGTRSRSTKETTISVAVDLDTPPPPLQPPFSTDTLPPPPPRISTRVPLVDTLLSELRASARFRIDVHCVGDVYIDDHHTAEDVAITLGQCINVALGDKAGLARMGCAEASDAGSTVRCVVDLSNRPCFNWDLPLEEEYVGGDEEAFGIMRMAAGGVAEGAGGMLCGAALTCEMLQHVFESLTIETRATVHIEVLQHDTAARGKGTKNLAIASARAYGKALAECVRVDPRRAGKVASSKGTLSI